MASGLAPPERSDHSLMPSGCRHGPRHLPLPPGPHRRGLPNHPVKDLTVSGVLGSEIQARSPVRVVATCTFEPAVEPDSADVHARALLEHRSSIVNGAGGSASHPGEPFGRFDCDSVRWTPASRWCRLRSLMSRLRLRAVDSSLATVPLEESDVWRGHSGQESLGGQ